jgi:hypothetical protein
VLLEQRAQVGARGADVAGREQPSPHREQVRGERDREPEELRDLGDVLVGAHLVRRDILENGAGMGRRAEGTARAGHPRHRVDDDAPGVDRGRDGPEREEHGGRVAARVRHEPALRRRQLGQPVRPPAELVRTRVLEAVPGLVLRRIGEPVSAREVDHDAASRGLESSGVLVRQAEEGHVGLAGERRGVRDQPRDALAAVAVETWVEGGRILSGERVRADGIELELGVAQHAVERLLAGVAGSADDADVGHAHSMHKRLEICVKR